MLNTWTSSAGRQTTTALIAAVYIAGLSGFSQDLSVFTHDTQDLRGFYA